MRNDDFVFFGLRVDNKLLVLEMEDGVRSGAFYVDGGRAGGPVLQFNKCLP